MNRTYRLRYCELCNHKKMDFQKGLLCGFTNDYATFERQCADFQGNENDTRKVKLMEMNDKNILENEYQSRTNTSSNSNQSTVSFMEIVKIIATLLSIGLAIAQCSK